MIRGHGRTQKNSESKLGAKARGKLEDSSGRYRHPQRSGQGYEPAVSRERAWTTPWLRSHKQVGRRLGQFAPDRPRPTRLCRDLGPWENGKIPEDRTQNREVSRSPTRFYNDGRQLPPPTPSRIRLAGPFFAPAQLKQPSPVYCLGPPEWPISPIGEDQSDSPEQSIRTFKGRSEPCLSEYFTSTSRSAPQKGLARHRTLEENRV